MAEARANRPRMKTPPRFIAADIADFRKRGGKIEKLGDTPLRSVAPSPFRSNAAERKAPTPVSRAASR